MDTNMLINFGLSLIPVILGIGVVWKKINAIRKALAETAETILTVTASLEDKKITEDELKKILVEMKQTAEQWKLVFSKTKTK